MDGFADALGRAGAWAGQNKYLGAIKNAFQNYMPATIAGAVGVLWCNVLVNNQTGLGKFWSGIMVLEVLNPIFSAMQFATIGCISIGICMLVGQEIAEANGEKGAYPAVLSFILLLMVTPTNFSIFYDTKKKAASYIAANRTGAIDAATKSFGKAVGSFSAIESSYIAATGLFTALLVGIIGLEIYNMFRKNDHLKIKMPEQVPPGVAKAFEVLIPTVLTCIVVGLVELVVQLLTGSELNALIFNSVQKPLQNIIGNNIVAVCVLYIIISLFWCVGIHGNNMVSGVKEPIFRPLLYANVAAFKKGEKIPYVFNLTMLQMFGEFGGSGVTIGLVIAILIFSKREDNRTIAGISLVPGLFNINETVTFGIPLVLNPILDIPFLLAPCVCLIVGYILINIGFCPKIVVEVPWTCPPVIFGFIATGGNIFGAISQLIVIAVSFLVYTPFLFIYERQQNKESAAAE